jgi:asparagine synthase (glutamine-hydrolysing)
MFERIGGVRNLGQKAHRLADTLSTEQRMGLYKSLVSHWHHPDQLVLNGSEPSTLFDRCPRNDRRGFIEQMMYVDSLSYLPGDILTKVDRASMGASLEVRVPFLDHRIIEFAWSVPLAYKIRDSKTKWLLRQVLRRYVPDELVERPKMGFGIPVGQWLRGPLREWAEDLLSESEINRHGYLRAAPIREKWREHVLGHNDWQYHLWDVLMFQSWLRCAN